MPGATLIGALLWSWLLAPGQDLVLVSRHDPGEVITARAAARLFMREKLFWGDGSRVVPVNLPPGNDLREAFSRTVLKRNRRELVEFWNEQHFKGVNPPVVLESEDAVKAFVRQVDGAVGYISRSRVDVDLRVLLVVPGS